MEQNSLTIQIDDRERAGGLAEALRRVTAFPIEVCRLTAGDARIGGQWLVERKATEDFAASLLDGRLERQISALAAAKERALLIIEGEWTARALAGMAAQSVRQAILNLELEWRIPVLRARDVGETALWLAALAERTAFALQPLPPLLQPAAALRSRPHPAAHRAPRPLAGPGEENLQRIPLAALERIPGIGAAKARALLDRFGSLAALLAADVQDLSAVPGIGPALAQTIQRKLR